MESQAANFYEHHNPYDTPVTEAPEPMNLGAKTTETSSAVRQTLSFLPAPKIEATEVPESFHCMPRRPWTFENIPAPTPDVEQPSPPTPEPEPTRPTRQNIWQELQAKLQSLLPKPSVRTFIPAGAVTAATVFLQK